MAGTGNDRLTGQFGPMQEKQQGNRTIGQPAKADRDLAADGQQAGQKHHADQGQGEVVGQETGTGHRDHPGGCQERSGDSNVMADYRLTPKSQQMPPKGHDQSYRRSVPGLPSLPRPVYGRTESLPNRALTRRHSHPWVQLSYAIQGVLEVQTRAGRFVAPPQRAVWIPAGVPHRVFSSPRTEMRSLYLDCSVTAWAQPRCHVLGVSDLLRELIRRFSQMPVEYQEDGAQGRLVQVLLDQLAEAPQIDLMLPLPQDSRLQKIYQSLQLHPEQATTLGHWSEKFAVTEKTLSRLFLRDTGLTFRAWRQRLRLLGALTPLEQGERVTDVALACGYDSTSAFIAAFRQQFGATPGEFFP